MERFDRILNAKKQDKIVSRHKMPTRKEGKDGDMMLVNGNLLIKDRGLWLKFSSNNETSDGTQTTNVTVTEHNYEITTGLTHSQLTNVGENQHHNKQHSIGSSADHSEVTGVTGTQKAVLSDAPTLTGEAIAATLKATTVKTGDIESSTGNNAISIAADGKVTIVGDLDVTGDFDVGGTETTTNSATVSITDLDFRIASNAADSAAADGAGFEVGSGGGVAKIQYNHNGGSSKWDWDKPIDMGANTITTTGTATVGKLDVDSLSLDGFNITSAAGMNIAASSGDSNISITPHGTGKVVISVVDINGGAIDGTTIGASSAANGTFGVLTSTTINPGQLIGAFDHNDQAVSNANIISGEINNTTIGATTHTTIKGTTIDATTDFTIGNTKLTDGNLETTAGLDIKMGASSGNDFVIKDASGNKKLVFETDTERLGIGDIPSANASVDIQVSRDDGSAEIGLHNSNGTITAANVLGEVSFAGSDDDDGYNIGAKIQSEATSTWNGGTNDAPANLSFWTNPDGTGALAERLTILSSGNVHVHNGIELGHLSDTTLARINEGDVSIAGNAIYRAGCGTGEGRIPVADGGTNQTTLIDKSVLISQDAGADTVYSKEMTTQGALLVGGSDGPDTARINGGAEFYRGINIVNGHNAITCAIEVGDGDGVATGPCLEFHSNKIEAKVNQTNTNKRLLKEDTGIAIDETLIPTWTGVHKFHGTLRACASGQNTNNLSLAAYIGGSKCPISGIVHSTGGDGAAHIVLGKDDMLVNYSAWGEHYEVDGDSNYGVWS